MLIPDSQTLFMHLKTCPSLLTCSNAKSVVEGHEKLGEMSTCFGMMNWCCVCLHVWWVCGGQRRVMDDSSRTFVVVAEMSQPWTQAHMHIHTPARFHQQALQMAWSTLVTSLAVAVWDSYAKCLSLWVHSLLRAEACVCVCVYLPFCCSIRLVDYVIDHYQVKRLLSNASCCHRHTYIFSPTTLF